MTHLVIQDGADDMRDEVRREPEKHQRGCPLFTHPTQRPPNHPTRCSCRPTRKEIDAILAVIEHRLAWLELNHTPDDFPAMVRRLADFARRR